MGLRRLARELALKTLYQIDLSGERSAETLKPLLSGFEKEPSREFARSLVEGVLENRAKLDAYLDETVANWSIERLSRIDHNILRIALFELINLEDVPARVTIDEAIELAKRYGDRNSSQFVNGVLDRLAERLALKGKGEERVTPKHG